MRCDRSDTEALFPYLQAMATQVTRHQVSLPGLTRREGRLGEDALYQAHDALRPLFVT